MLDLAFLERPPPVFAGPLLAAGDARLGRVLRSSNQGEYEEAAREAASLFAQRTYDVQLLVRYLFGVFLERGPAVLPQILEGVARALRDGFDPEQAPDRSKTTTDISVGWLLRTLRERIEYHRLNRDETYKGWITAGDAAGVESIRAAAAALRIEIERRLPTTRCTEQLTALDACLGDLCRAVLAKPALPKAPPPKLPDPPAAPAIEDDPLGNEPSEPPPERPMAPPVGRAPAAALSPSGVFDSAPLRLLLDKLDAFDQLMARGDFERAAIVAHDLNRVVEHFDPRVYLPKLFSGYFRRLASGAGNLSPHWETAESMSSRALEQLYQVDLDAFLEET